ncbi:hypothetical protein NDU88_006608 [Pleurodeles waltl]|uniref:Uncharacterized protein n=1 Tax=Pleurodeles waltl TaxID=8319 RepID=A0AAV7QIE5_PLEWA|nr:hypothetical protein NDU88_006608 [Pleurodeles waltl]
MSSACGEDGEEAHLGETVRVLEALTQEAEIVIQGKRLAPSGEVIQLDQQWVVEVVAALSGGGTSPVVSMDGDEIRDSEVELGSSFSGDLDIEMPVVMPDTGDDLI